MSRYFKRKRPKASIDFTTVASTMKTLYLSKLLPLEKAYKYHEVYSPPLSEAYFDAKPMVLLIGQYSTGKTTFIQYVLNSDFPESRVGPEPTTDKFVVVMHSDTRTTIPGNVAVVDRSKQFQQLATFGNNFLNRFLCSCLPNEVLESISIIDTPGILSGEKQKVDRDYNFSAVVKYFGNMADRIILMFDPSKLDVSDEFRDIIESLKENENKIRIVLNKADTVNQQQLIRVFGALMWGLGKLFKNPEVPPVYMGSFWDRPLQNDGNRQLFALDQEDLFTDLQSLPKYALIQKLNDLIRRTRSVMMHAYIIAELHKEMPSVLGKESKKQELISNIPQICSRISMKYSLSDSPPIPALRSYLQGQDFRKFSGLQHKLIDEADSMLTKDVPRILERMQQEQVVDSSSFRAPVSGGVFQKTALNPDEEINRGMIDRTWIVETSVPDSFEIFQKLNPPDGKMDIAMARIEFEKSGLSERVINRICDLADVDGDRCFSVEEFALARHLIKIKFEGSVLPSVLPYQLYPPSFRLNLA